MSPSEAATGPDVKFRVMRGDDLDQVFELIDVAFGDRWPKLPIQVPKRDHLAWKISAPELTEDPPELVECDGRIVGYVGGSAVGLWVQGKRIRGWHGGDFCIHPDFQELGLTTPWREWREKEKFPLIPPGTAIGEGSTHPRLIRSSKRLDDRVLIANKVDRLALPPGFAAIAGGGSDSRMSARSLFRAVRTAVKLQVRRQRWRPYSEPVTSLTVQTVESFDERADQLWELVKAEFDFAKIRDQQYLNWRFCDPRAGVYRVRAVEDGDELLGFMVMSTTGGDAQIVDLMVAPGRIDALRALLEDALAKVRRDGTSSVTVLLPHVHPYRETFLRYGFIKYHRVGPMGFGRRDDSPLYFLERDKRARLHVAFGDEDHV